MRWTEAARREHDKRWLRYASDCTDEEWAIVAPLLARTTKVGRPRLHRARDLWNAIQYLAATGCQWAQLPKEFPPFTTVQYHFYRMRDGGLLDGLVRPPDIQDRDGAPDLIERCRDAYPTLAPLFADGGYAGQKLKTAIAHLDQFAIEITKRSESTASSSCPAAGSSSAPSPGSTDADASPRTGRHPSLPPKHGSSSLPSGE